jgi:DNA-binding HxlR family transcriptional regulator
VITSSTAPLPVLDTVIDCANRTLFDHITSKWGVLILATLAAGTMRWSELRRSIAGITEKMLVQTLRTLESDGLVLREPLPVVPPHVEYNLTPKGRDVVTVLLPLLDWIHEHAED